LNRGAGAFAGFGFSAFLTHLTANAALAKTDSNKEKADFIGICVPWEKVMEQIVSTVRVTQC